MNYSFRRGDNKMGYKILYDNENCTNAFFRINCDTITPFDHFYKLSKF